MSCQRDERTVVYFVRHGDVEQNGVKGHPGPGLSERGKEQAKRVAKEFEKIGKMIDGMYSSTMTRAIETAEEISKKIGKDFEKIHDLSEFSWRFFFPKEYRGKLPRFFKRAYWKHFFMHKKSLKALDEILEKNPGKRIIIVAHGNVIRGLVGAKLGMPFKKMGLLKTYNCGIAKCKFKGKKLSRVTYWNSLRLEEDLYNRTNSKDHGRKREFAFDRG